MRLLSFQEVQSISNSILVHIKELCEANSITFYLAYGTVLGAVRHRGFIPWDDDIDVYFTRDEFVKFEEAVCQENSKYSLMSVYSNKEYCHPLVKYVDTATCMNWPIVKIKPNYGVWVDIYVLDNVPDNEIALRFFQLRLNFLQKCYEYSLYRVRKNRFKGIVKVLLLGWSDLFGPRFFSKRLVRLSQKYNSYKTRRFAPNAFTAASRKEAVLEKGIIGSGTDAVFEGEHYLIPEKTDDYLHHFYGDFMTLPPEEDRTPNHSVDFYLLDND